MALTKEKLKDLFAAGEFDQYLSDPVVTWASITGKPSTFPPSTHNHTKAQITDFPTSMPASDVSAWAKASTKPTYTAAEVGAAASEHEHSYLPLSGGGAINYSLGGSATIINATNNDANAYNQPSTYGIAITGRNNILSIGLGSTINDRKAFIQSGHASPQYASAVGELWLNPLGGTVRIGDKTGNIALHTGNYNSYAPTKTGSGASGTWPISITGNVNKASGMFRVTTPSGYVDIGPANASWTHFSTDRPRFHFNKGVDVQGDIMAGPSYNQRVYHAGNLRHGTAAPTGGVDGDIYIQYW